MKINVFQTTFRAPAERALRARARHAAAFVAALLFGGAMPALHAQTLTATGNLTEASMHHATTLLADGRVLLVKTDRKAMRFDATSDTWSAVASPTAASTNATLTRLNDGSVLRAGGYASGGAAVASVERFTANTGVWAAATTMSTARLAHTATVMADGGVLMVGGSSAVNLPRVDLASVERFDAVNGLWTAAPTLPATRTSHSATRLANGDLIVLGGYVAGTLSNTCVRLPQGAASWVPCAAMTQARAGHVSTLLADGRIFVSGGVAAASGFEEIYAWNTDSWVSTSLPARTSTSHVVFELTPGVLVLWGGAPASAYSLGTGPAPNVPGAVSYAIASGSVATLPSLPARSGHAATVLADGRALISGGFTTYAVTSSLGTFFNAIALDSSYTLPLERLDADLLFPARSGSLPWMPAAGESYRVIASASSSLYGGALPGGTMTISNGVNSCTMTLPETSCRLQVAAAGQQNYTVRYSGDPVYAPKTAAATLPAGDMLRIQRVGDVAGFVSSNVGGAFGFASCGTNYGPIPDQCDLHPAPGAAVMLDVSLPSSAITFVGWQGACAGSATRCSLTMPASGSLAVRAVFAPTPTTGPTPTPVAPLSMNFTGSSAISAAADGALVARYLRRLHGPTLAARLLGGNPTGATLDGIEDRVDALSPLLDVDQNGVVDADTDGVIILRYLLGYRGPALTANAIGVGARRTDPALIAADLAKLVP